jgi:hypothetical protein
MERLFAMLLDCFYSVGGDESEKIKRGIRLLLFFGYCTTLILLWGQPKGMALSSLAIAAFLLPWFMIFFIALAPPLIVLGSVMTTLGIFELYGGAHGTLAILLAVAGTILLDITLGKLYRWTLWVEKWYASHG